MRKYLLPVGLILAFGLVWAGAQTLTKSLQGAQDPRGPVPMDASNNLYIPYHLNNAGQPKPVTYTSFSAATGATNTDFAGVVSSSTTSGTILFGQVYNSAPACILQELAGSTAPTFTVATTGINATTVAGSSTKYNYICVGANW